MNTFDRSNTNLSRPISCAMGPLLVLAILVTSTFASRRIQQPEQQVFGSAPEAVQALIEAVQKKDENAINKILGGPEDLFHSDDQVQDELDRSLFVEKYREMHRLGREADGSLVLYIGAENWPFPLRLVEKDGSWRFDPDQGRNEILFRRIGENELTAIATCREFAIAHKEYTAEPKTTNPEESSPASLVQKAAAGSAGGPILMYGYYFRVVPKRSANGSNGYVFIAYPAEYRSSGVMTFVITEDGVVYEKDLGAKTSSLAGSMASFNKDATWHVSDE
jgi:hypothetical protein